MNKIILLSVVAIMALGNASPSIAAAPSATDLKVGSTEAEIKKAIASSVDVKKVDFVSGDNPNLKVSAGFEVGKCNRIRFATINKHKIPPKTLMDILLVNSGGVPWGVQMKSNAGDKVYYTSKDGKYRAVLTNGNSILIFTDALFQKSMKEMIAEEKKSK
jgi:hypothetical protein